MKQRVSGNMASSLQDLWQKGKAGSLTPLQQTRAWALREVYREMKVPEKKLYSKVALKLKKVGGGSPTPRAVLRLFEKVDSGHGWYPGKVAAGRGRKPALSGLARSVIKRSAEAMKRSGHEPTFARVLATCAGAVQNPSTKRPVDKKRIYDTFRDECYDEGADQPWKHRKRLTKTALPEDVVTKRLAWQKFMVGLGHSSAWYYNSLIWIDLCNSIIPTTEQKATQQALARKSGSGWMSAGCQQYSRNLKGSKECLKQNSYGTFKVWWMPVLTCGKLHIECFNAEFPGEGPKGAEIAASRLGPILNRRFPNARKPTIVMTDMGRGFYHGPTGKIIKRYKAGLQSVGLRPFMGDDAQKQPGTMQDLMLHETAVSWMRAKLTTTCPARPWKETREQYQARLHECCRQVNAEYDVEGLCRELPSRLEELKRRKGDRLKK